jgi:hypothetical protein
MAGGTTTAGKRQLVGWVERSETHQSVRGRRSMMGFAALYPSYLSPQFLALPDGQNTPHAGQARASQLF